MNDAETKFTFLNHLLPLKLSESYVYGHMVCWLGVAHATIHVFET